MFTATKKDVLSSYKKVLLIGYLEVESQVVPNWFLQQVARNKLHS